MVKQIKQNHHHTNPYGLHNVKWRWNASVKYGPKDVLPLHFIYFLDGCALSQGLGIAVTGTALPQNKKMSFASWLLLQPWWLFGTPGRCTGEEHEKQADGAAFNTVAPSAKRCKPRTHATCDGRTFGCGVRAISYSAAEPRAIQEIP